MARAQQKAADEDQLTDAPEWATRPAEDSQVAPATPRGGPGASIGGETFGPAMMALTSWLSARANRTDEDGWKDIERAVSKILSGQSAEDVLSKDLPIQGKTFLDQPFVLYGFDITESDFEEGSPFYANLDVAIGSPPERRVLNVGGIKVLAKLMKLEEIGEFPYTLKLTGDTTKRGYTVLDLELPM